MLGFSVFVFIGSIVDMLFWATDKVILGMLSGSVAVAIYNVGGTFNNMVMNLSTSISGVLTPRVTGMVVKDASKDELTNLFIRVGRLQFIVIALIVSGFTAFGQAFITLWAGKDYHDAYWVAILTMFPLCVPLIQNIGLTIVTAQNKHQFRSIIYMIIAILNVVTTYIAVPYCGILGAATCSCFAYILGQGIVMNIYYYKVTGLDIPLFWKNILKMAIVPGIMMFSGLLINRIYEIDNWIIFLIGIIVFTGIYIVLMYEVSFNEYERSIFREPLKRIIKRIKG
jgi:O-antigen/teichoic acid export membrane protein